MREGFVLPRLGDLVETDRIVPPKVRGLVDDAGGCRGRGQRVGDIDKSAILHTAGIEGQHDHGQRVTDGRAYLFAEVRRRGQREIGCGTRLCFVAGVCGHRESSVRRHGGTGIFEQHERAVARVGEIYRRAVLYRRDFARRGKRHAVGVSYAKPIVGGVERERVAYGQTVIFAVLSAEQTEPRQKVGEPQRKFVPAVAHRVDGDAERVVETKRERTAAPLGADAQQTAALSVGGDVSARPKVEHLARVKAVGTRRRKGVVGDGQRLA